MIKRLIEPAEVALIISVNDDVEERYGCLKGEWVQFLVSICEDPRVFIVGIFDEEDNMIGYALSQNYVCPPLSNAVHIIYACSPGNTEDNELGMESIKEWARGLGANKITATTRSPEILLGRYDFKESEYRILEIDL